MARKIKRLKASEVIKRSGGAAALARHLSALGHDTITRGAVNQWVMKGDQIPVDRCWQCEQVLRKLGKPGTRFEMRPDEIGPDPRTENQEVAA